MSTIVKYSSGSTYTIVPNKIDIEKVQDLDGQYHVPFSSIVGMLRLGLGVQRITVSGDALDMSACLWHDVVAISFDSGTSYQTVYFAGVPYTSDCWSGIYPYALSLLASPLKEQTAVRYPTTGYKWGNQAITGISQAGNINAHPVIHYLAPLFYAPLSNTLLDLAGQSVTFTRTASKTHNGVVYPINTPIFDSGLYLASDTAQDVATWISPVPASIPNVIPNVIFAIEGDSITEGALNPTLGRLNWPLQTGNLSETFRLGIVHNFALGGDTAEAMVAEYATQAHTVKPTSPSQGCFFLFAGVNDIGGMGYQAAPIYANLKTIWASARADGYKVIAFTITPNTGWTVGNGKETVRLALNVLIRSDATLYDACVPGDVLLPDASNGTYFLDGVHLSPAGSLILSGAVALAISQVFDLNPLQLRTIAMQIKSRYPSTWSIGGGGVNLLTENQSNAETDTTGVAVDAGTLTRNTVTPLAGTGDFKVVAVTGAAFYTSTLTAVAAGVWYCGQVLVKTSGCASGRQVRLSFIWKDAGGTNLNIPLGPQVSAPTTATILSIAEQAPALATTCFLYVEIVSAADDEILYADNLMVEGLPSQMYIWTAAQNKLWIQTSSNQIAMYDDTTPLTMDFPLAAYLAGTVVDIVVIEDTSHAATIAVHPAGGSWTATSGTLAALVWPQLTLGNLEGSIANLIQYPYVLTSAEYQAINYSSLSSLYNTLYIGNRYAGEIIKGSDGRLVNAAGTDISALLGGTDIAIGAAAVTIAQSQGLSARWYVEVKRTDV